MPDYEAIASAEYIIRGYVKADDAMQEHQRTGSEGAIRRAAAALCDALTDLESDGRFWSGLTEPQSLRGDLRQQLRDLDSLLGVERQVLTHAGLPQSSVNEILRDAGAALNSYEDWPDPYAAERLRDAVGTAARAACIEAGFKRELPPTKRWVRARKAAGGAVIMVANAVAAPPQFKDVSTLIGEIVIVHSTLPDEVR